MYRSAINRNVFNKTFLLISKRSDNQCIRLQSTYEKKSLLPKVGLIVGSSLIVISGGALAYAKYDQKFRKTLTDSIPYSQTLLDSILGPSLPAPLSPPISSPVTQAKLSKSNDNNLESSLLKKRQEREQLQQTSGASVQAIQPNTKPTEEQVVISSSDQKVENKIKDIIEVSKQQTTTSIDEDKEKLILDSDQEFILIETGDRINGNTIDMKTRTELELEYQRKLNKIRERLEEDLRQHLKRQLAAHNEYLEEQLQALTNELDRKHRAYLEESLLEVKNNYQNDLSQSFYKINALEAQLNAREQLDKEEFASRELWLVVQQIKDALRYSSDNIMDEIIPRPLKNEINAVKERLNEYLIANPVVKLALESIPNEALEYGVYSEDDLINRFTTVNRICRRVALIGDEDANLFQYALSFLNSILIFEKSKIARSELEGKEEVDPTKWDTFDVLVRVRHSLARNNLEQALRYANQLKGKPRKVARDWIKDARTHLETRQAADLLLGQAASISVQVLV